MNKPSPDPVFQNSSHLLNLLMKHVPYSIYFKDRESRFIRINKECADKFGLDDPEEAVGKTDFDFFDEEHAQRAFNEEQEIMKTGEPIINVLESEGKYQSGKRTHWASTSKFPFYDDENSIVGTFGITGDVTDQIEAEEALRNSEKKYRNIFDNIQDVFYRTDTQGIVTDISPSIERYSGYKQSEIIGFPVVKFYYHQEDREKLVHQLLQTGKVTDYEVRLKTSDGRLVYTSITSHIIKDKSGKPNGVEGIMRDISERKIAEIKLKQSDETLSKLSKQVPGTIYQFQQFPDGSSCFPFASNGIKDIYEVTPEEVKHDASKAIERTYSEDLDRLIDTINHSYHTLTDWELEYRG
ncbi:MAG: PAS domain S-box protein [Balneolaceae bacterium]